MAGKKKTLKPNDKYFVELYTLPGEFMGNAVKAFMEANEIDCPTTKTYKRQIQDEVTGKTITVDDYFPQYKVAKSSAHRLLTRAYIRDYAQELLLKLKNDIFVDSEMMRAIAQNRDMASKIRGIEHYNDLLKRINRKFEFTVDDRRELTPAQIAAMAATVSKKAKK